tara:strand:+ start:133 stop:483 length:351 start_codon:yes stop_codon:yes gene_type:complete
MFNFLKKTQNAHSQIDSLMKGDPLKDLLKNITKIEDSYELPNFSQSKMPIVFKNNFLGSIVESGINKNLNFEDLFNLSLQGQLGKENNIDWLLSGGKDKANLNVGMNLDILKQLFK